MARIGGTLAHGQTLGGKRRRARRDRLEPAAAIRIQFILFAVSWASIAYGVSRLI